MKKRSWVLSVLLFLLMVVITQRTVLFQEGNPLAIGWGVAQLAVGDAEIVQISEEPVKYLMDADTNAEPFIKMMRKKGWHFEERMGGGLVFKKQGEAFLATQRMWTRQYIVVSYSDDAK